MMAKAPNLEMCMAEGGKLFFNSLLGTLIFHHLVVTVPTDQRKGMPPSSQSPGFGLPYCFLHFKKFLLFSEKGIVKATLGRLKKNKSTYMSGSVYLMF